MLLRVQFGEEQKYVKLSELTFDAFLKEESRQPDIKVYDQSDTEVDTEVFEETVKESPGTLRIMLGNGGLDASQLSSCSGTSDDTVILNFTMCDPVEEEAAAEGSQPKRPCHINYEAKADGKNFNGLHVFISVEPWKDSKAALGIVIKQASPRPFLCAPSGLTSHSVSPHQSRQVRDIPDGMRTCRVTGKLCDYLVFLKDMELDSAMPQLYKLFSLVATIGATSAGVERSFSCLKRLKSYTRNTMGQGSLSSLALLAIERTLVKSLEKTPSCETLRWLTVSTGEHQAC
ncbi:Zinc finger MYM-type protein 1 [Anabarilius grahami]|uniref:Zinc finger MYM-type protein 1 n=1 Tax=Anabarilius grahami TaxID=495550 RepID=A0A3N0Y8J4_ANAGA|nr:Zinc finger MYM-type protein 1 [Anabarilius grahami]